MSLLAAAHGIDHWVKLVLVCVLPVLPSALVEVWWRRHVRRRAERLFVLPEGGAWGASPAPDLEAAVVGATRNESRREVLPNESELARLLRERRDSRGSQLRIQVGVGGRG